MEGKLRPLWDQMSQREESASSSCSISRSERGRRERRSPFRSICLLVLWSDSEAVCSRQLAFLLQVYADASVAAAAAALLQSLGSTGLFSAAVSQPVTTHAAVFLASVNGSMAQSPVHQVLLCRRRDMRGHLFYLSRRPPTSFPRLLPLFPRETI